jgi:hypothetical protein
VSFLGSAGLIWMLNGGKVLELHRTWAVVSIPVNRSQRVFYRRSVEHAKIGLPWAQQGRDGTARPGTRGRFVFGQASARPIRINLPLVMQIGRHGALSPAPKAGLCFWRALGGPRKQKSPGRSNQGSLRTAAGSCGIMSRRR